MTLYDSYAEHFGIAQADQLLVAAAEHRLAGSHQWARVTGEGEPDPFLTAVISAIVFECVEYYAPQHSIEVPYVDFVVWVKAHANVGDYEGQIDTIAALAVDWSMFLPAPVVIPIE